MSDNDNLMLPCDAAEFLSIPLGTLHEMDRNGEGPTSIMVGPKTKRYTKADLIAFVNARRKPGATEKAAERAAAKAAPAEKPSPALTAAVNAIVATERRRMALIAARAPCGFEQAAQAAIRDGLSLEAFDASLPGHYRAVLPPLHRFIADFDRPDDGGNASADYIINAVRAAKGN